MGQMALCNVKNVKLTDNYYPTLQFLSVLQSCHRRNKLCSSSCGFGFKAGTEPGFEPKGSFILGFYAET